jgi:hypothetical protein
MKVIHTNKIETAAAMVKEHGAIPINGSIRACYGLNKELYCLPMYVINAPEKYGILDAMNIHKSAEETMNVK